MKNTLFDLSGKIDQEKVEALSIVKKVADSLSIPFFVVGASARDFILENCYNRKSPRMTRDIDLGVKVASWEMFDQLTKSLLSTGRFTSMAERHRFRLNSVFIDIIPFGVITGKSKRISWPPEHEIFMNMLGFDEAYEYSTILKLSSNPDLDIKVPTLPGLSLMKLISWQDRFPRRKTDAEDVLFIMQNYDEAGNYDRLYDTEQNLLEEESFNTRYAAIRLLGRDMAKIADPDTFGKVKTILDSETEEQSQNRLVIDMMQFIPMYDTKFDEILSQVKKLRRGLVELSEHLIS